MATGGASCYNACRALAMIRNLRTGQVIASRVTWCTTFLTRGLGLMFHPPLKEDQAYIFDEGRESRGMTTIHMLFVFFPLAVIWLDAGKRVVDKALARPFYPYYAPSSPAQYYLECHPRTLYMAEIGDQLQFSPPSKVNSGPNHTEAR